MTKRFYEFRLAWQISFLRFDARVGSSSNLINPSPTRNEISLIPAMPMMIFCTKKFSVENFFVFLIWVSRVYFIIHYFQIRL